MRAIYCWSHPSHLQLPFAVSHFLSDSILCARSEVVSAPTHQTCEESRRPRNYEGSIPASHYLLFFYLKGLIQWYPISTPKEVNVLSVLTQII